MSELNDLKQREQELAAEAERVNAGRKPKFGDRMMNPWAGEGNPHRIGLFVREGRNTGRMNPGRWYEFTDGKGEFWQTRAQFAQFVDAATPAPQAAPSDALETEIRKLTQWKHCMSYNDSYFGEPAGLVKRVAYQLERILDRSAASLTHPAPSGPTELEHRLRETADQQPGWKPLLTAAADEIKRLTAAVTQAAPSEPVGYLTMAEYHRLCDGSEARIMPEPSDIEVTYAVYRAAPLAAQQSPADARDAALNDPVVLEALKEHWAMAVSRRARTTYAPDQVHLDNVIERLDAAIAAATTSTEGR